MSFTLVYTDEIDKYTLHQLIHSYTYSPTHSSTYSLTLSLTHSLIHSPTSSLTCRFSPRARLCSILLVLWVVLVLRILRIRNSLTVLMFQRDGSIWRTWAALNSPPRVLMRCSAGVMRGSCELRRGREYQLLTATHRLLTCRLVVNILIVTSDTSSVDTLDCDPINSRQYNTQCLQRVTGRARTHVH